MSFKEMNDLHTGDHIRNIFDGEVRMIYETYAGQKLYMGSRYLYPISQLYPEDWELIKKEA